MTLLMAIQSYETKSQRAVCRADTGRPINLRTLSFPYTPFLRIRSTCISLLLFLKNVKIKIYILTVGIEKLHSIHHAHRGEGEEGG